MNARRPIRRIASGVGVLALVAAGIIGGASMASAAGQPGPGQPGAPTEGTLIVHKYAGSTTGQPNNGTEQTINRPPLAGVTFEITEVGKNSGGTCVPLDLGTAAGWTDAQAAIGSIPPATPYCLVPNTAQSETTNADGAATFDELDLRLYYVEETDAPAGVDPSVEHYVSVPYPSVSGENTTWLYEVNTYPKNDLDGKGDKTVADPATNGLGSTIPWTIKSKPIGSFNNGEKLTTFSFVDTLDPKLTYTATPAPTVTYTTPGGTAMTVDDFTVTTGPGNTLTATLDDMEWVNELPAGTYFEFTFSTTVTGVGDIKNEGFQNTGGDNVTLGTASTQWGQAEILKHQKGDKTKTLEGAKFSVFNSPNGTNCTGTLGAALTVSGQTEFASGATGIVTIPGLWVGNDAQVPSRVYCVVETVAPVGFVLDVTPRAITVTTGTTATVELEVANTPVSGPALPMTGANGTLWFTVGGIALIVMAGGGLLLVRRARTHD